MEDNHYIELFRKLGRTDKPQRKKPYELEHQIQVACVRWFRLTHQSLAYNLFAVPNGGRRDAATGSKLKEEGVLAGVADLILLVPRQGCHGLLIEMKTPKGSQTEAQRQWQTKATAQGYMYVICRSLDDFIQVINDYLR